MWFMNLMAMKSLERVGPLLMTWMKFERNCWFIKMLAQRLKPHAASMLSHKRVKKFRFRNKLLSTPLTPEEQQNETSMSPVIEQDQGNSDEAATIFSRQVNKVLEQAGPSGVVVLEDQVEGTPGDRDNQPSRNVFVPTISVTPAPTISISQLQTSSEHDNFQAAINQIVTSIDGVTNSIVITPGSKETRTVSSPANRKFQSVLVSIEY